MSPNAGCACRCEWLFNNREKKRDEFKKLQQQWEKPFASAEERAALDRRLEEAVPRFLRGGDEVRRRDGKVCLLYTSPSPRDA